MSTKEQRVIRTIAEQLGLEESAVTPEKKLVDHLGADSLDQIELVMTIEDDFGIEIDNDDAEKLQTVQQVIDYVNGRKDAR